MPPQSGVLLTMKNLFQPMIAPRISLIILCALGLTSAMAQTIPPVPLNSQPVACSDVEMDPSRLPAGVTPQDAWRGERGGYITQALARTTSAEAGPLAFPAKMPNNPSIFKNYNNAFVPTMTLVCYPTTATNPRADYRLPNDQIVPKMQRGAELPIFAETNKRYPIVLLSHGLGGAPLDLDYLSVIKRFASEGYVVVAPFHADQRFITVKLNSFGDALDVVRDYQRIAEAMAIRPVAVSETLNYFLTHPAYRDHIDANTIGGWGASLGGQTMLLNQGAKLTTSLGSAGPEVVITDKRIKAIVGYVPYSGIDYGVIASVATFGSGNDGVKGIRTPYLGIGGSEDTTAPMSQTQRMFRSLSGSRYLVEIQGLGHTIRQEDVGDIFTWSLLFYRAHLHGDAAARGQLSTLQNVTGGANEKLLSATTQPWWYQDEAEVTEYYHAGINHYFMTAIDGEKTSLDANPAWGWKRTGERFIGWRASAANGTTAFRFYHDAKGVGVNTHFFTLDPAEANILRGQGAEWAEEVSQWKANFAATTCGAGLVPLTRAYNNRFALRDSNHRFMTQAAIVTQMKNAGWVVEGNTMCVIAP
jgi:predicted dienelactone hydrolase